MKLISGFKKLPKSKRFTLWVFLLILFWYAVPRFVAMGTFFGAHKPSLSDEFDLVAEMLPSEKAIVSHVRVGLPHNFQETGSFYAALWFSNIYSYDGYLFEEKKVATSQLFNEVTTSILTSAESYEPYGDPKLCGGYHADYMFTLKENGADYHFMVCFGCHEVLIYTPSCSRIVDLERESYDKLREVWQSEFE